MALKRKFVVPGLPALSGKNSWLAPLAFSGALLAVWLSGVVVALAADVPVQTSSPAPGPLPNGEKLLETYCYDCHGDGANKGQIALDEMLQPDTTASHAHDWQKAWQIVRREFMPPVTAPRPSDAERKAITQWIAQKELAVDYAHPDPGRVTIRRLNRMEYEYTISDLFGMDLTAQQDYMSDAGVERLRLRDRLPPDDTAFGFDNNGDFLTLSSPTLEKFFGIAEYVVSRVIFPDGPVYIQRDFALTDFKTVKAAKVGHTTSTVEFDLARPGKYRVDTSYMVGDFAEIPGTFDVRITVDDQPIATDQVEVGGYKPHHYANEINLGVGHHSLVLFTDAIKPDANGDFHYMEAKPEARLTGPIGPGLAEYPASHQRIFFQGAPPPNAKKRRAYAKAIVQRVADRAFRRPTDDATLERLTDLVMQNDKFEYGVGQALTAILTSPKFLFRAELQPRPDDPKTTHLIDEYALASRLSYLIWLSLPDDELTRLAAHGQLRKNLRAQVDRLLADPKSSRLFEDFPGQWLRTRNVLMTAISRDDAILKPVRKSMKRETDMLFEDIARHDRDLLELVTADYTFVDAKLAKYYGLPSVTGDDFQKVHLAPETKRGGILTQASFLTSTSNPNRTSPVKRGVFVLENLLGTPPPPPPANVPPLDDAKVHGVVPATVREQLAVHRENKACATCHAHFDPIGIVLENYDFIGRWRDTENDAKIDPHGVTATGEEVSSVEDLRKFFVANKEKYYRCVTEKLMTYALGRGIEPADAVTVDRITDQLMADHGKFSNLLMGVIDSPAFQTRRGDDGLAREAPRFEVPKGAPVARRGRGRRFGLNGLNAGGTNNPPPTAATGNTQAVAGDALPAQNPQPK